MARCRWRSSQILAEQQGGGDSQYHHKDLRVCLGRVTINTVSGRKSALTKAHSRCEIKHIYRLAWRGDEYAWRDSPLSTFWEIFFFFFFQCVCRHPFFFTFIRSVLSILGFVLSVVLSHPDRTHTRYNFPQKGRLCHVNVGLCSVSLSHCPLWCI